jgi:acyl-coenzyme A synthetase/AMP-(fatty) acid ligase
MKRSRFSEEQIIGFVKEHQPGLSAVEICRKYGASDATLFNSGTTGRPKMAFYDLHGLIGVIRRGIRVAGGTIKAVPSLRTYAPDCW